MTESQRKVDLLDELRHFCKPRENRQPARFSVPVETNIHFLLSDASTLAVSAFT